MQSSQADFKLLSSNLERKANQQNCCLSYIFEVEKEYTLNADLQPISSRLDVTDTSLSLANYASNNKPLVFMSIHLTSIHQMGRVIHLVIVILKGSARYTVYYYEVVYLAAMGDCLDKWDITRRLCRTSLLEIARNGDKRLWCQQDRPATRRSSLREMEEGLVRPLVCCCSAESQTAVAAGDVAAVDVMLLMSCCLILMPGFL